MYSKPSNLVLINDINDGDEPDVNLPVVDESGPSDLHITLERHFCLWMEIFSS